MKLSKFLLLMGAEQEVTIDCDGEIIYEGTLGDCKIPMKEFRQMEVFATYSSRGRVPHEIVIQCSRIK